MATSPAAATPAGAKLSVDARLAHLVGAGPIAFQGAPGAFSDLACRVCFPERATVPCRTFADVFAAVNEGRARLAMIPVDNSIAGRVADIHHLLPGAGLHIVAEHFQEVNHQLLALPGVRLEDIRQIHSHVHALSQCRGIIARLGAEAVVAMDTAGAAAELVADGARDRAVIASRLAAETYGLTILAADVQDVSENTTRFLVMTQAALMPPNDGAALVTSLLFRVRSRPAALYKALGGFATNGVNITKLESYIVGSRFDVAQFYMDIDGHPESRPVKLALEELGFFSREVRILGVYPAHPFRMNTGIGDDD